MSEGKRSGDIETVLQWTYAQTARVDYRIGSQRSLVFNHGYTAIPKGCHNRFDGGDVVVSLLPLSADDAKRIIAAVEALDPWTAAIVTRCAKDRNRPDCFVGVEAREVEVKTYPVRRNRKGRSRKLHKPIVTKRWEPCHPTAICAAREIYGRWHTALGRLASLLDGQLTDWRISGFAAPETPWIGALQKSA